MAQKLSYYLQSSADNKLFLAIFWVFLIALALFLVPIQDYREYIIQWKLVLDGNNPWTDLGYNKTNTYGPIHSMMAIFSYGTPFLSRVLSTIAGISIFYLLRSEGKKSNTEINTHIHFLYNPFVWITCSIIGHNDAFIGLFILLAVICFESNKLASSGALIAVGVWYKIYPLIFLPFLMFQNRKIKWKLFLSFIGSSIAILTLSFILWENNFFYSFSYNTVRPSKFLSIFRFLRGDYAPFGDGFDAYSLYLVLASQAVFYVWYLFKKPDTILSAIISFLILLLFYKVGHAQFHFTAIILLLYFLASHQKTAISPGLHLSIFVYIYWLTGITVVDHIITVSGHSNYYIRELSGLINSIVMCNLIVFLIVHAQKTNTAFRHSSPSSKSLHSS